MIVNICKLISVCLNADATQHVDAPKKKRGRPAILRESNYLYFISYLIVFYIYIFF